MYGSNRERHKEIKRPVPDDEIGLLLCFELDV